MHVNLQIQTHSLIVGNNRYAYKNSILILDSLVDDCSEDKHSAFPIFLYWNFLH